MKTIEEAWAQAEKEGRIFSMELSPEIEEKTAEETGAVSMTKKGELAGIIAEVMRPVMESVGAILTHNAEQLKNNTQAIQEIAGYMNQLSAAQAIQNDRMEALEKQIRLQTPVTGKQVRYLNDEIRKKARETLDRWELADDAKACRKAGDAIRKAVLSRYGYGSLSEIPRHEYPVAMEQIGMWSNALLVRDIVREARARKEAEVDAGDNG